VTLVEDVGQLAVSRPPYGHPQLSTRQGAFLWPGEGVFTETMPSSCWHRSPEPKKSVIWASQNELAHGRPSKRPVL
jgi:hypothetical protein